MIYLFRRGEVLGTTPHYFKEELSSVTYLLNGNLCQMSHQRPRKSRP